jgi:hypothetical protein
VEFLSQTPPAGLRKPALSQHGSFIRVVAVTHFHKCQLIWRVWRSHFHAEDGLYGCPLTLGISFAYYLPKKTYPAAAGYVIIL